MRKYKSGFLLFAAAAFFLMLASGCSMPPEGEYVSREEELLQQAVDDFFQAVDARDAERIKEMFASNVREESSDLDEMLERLFAFYPGPTDNCELNGEPSGDYTTDYGVRTKTIHNWFAVVSGDINYYCRITYTYRDDVDKDNVGIRQVTLISEKVMCSEDFKWPEEDGIQVIEDAPGDYMTRRIGYNPVIYTPVDRTVTKEEILEFLDENDDYDDFVDYFGEPNAVNCPWLCYAYELPDENGEKRYAELWVDYPRGSKQGTIYQVFLLNDTSNIRLEVLWEKD